MYPENACKGLELDRPVRINPETNTPKDRQVGCFHVEVYVTYKAFEHDHYKGRLYYAGLCVIALVRIYPVGTQRSGNVQVLLNNKSLGNGGEWFKNIKLAEKYIEEKLEEGI